MGNQFFDKFSYLHFAVGVVVYYFNISILQWYIIHTIFEFFENTRIGVNFINNYLSFWPGGKPKSDQFINIFGDTVFAMLGWISAYYFTKLCEKYKWTAPHIQW